MYVHKTYRYVHTVYIHTVHACTVKQDIQYIVRTYNYGYHNILLHNNLNSLEIVCFLLGKPKTLVMSYHNTIYSSLNGCNNLAGFFV